MVCVATRKLVGSMLYYWFALDSFGSRNRIRLPQCVVSAVRAKYPQSVTSDDYKGHVDIQSDDDEYT